VASDLMASFDLFEFELHLSAEKTETHDQKSSIAVGAQRFIA
jgi:hypothetical protein